MRRTVLRIREKMEIDLWNFFLLRHFDERLQMIKRRVDVRFRKESRKIDRTARIARMRARIFQNFVSKNDPSWIAIMIFG